MEISTSEDKMNKDKWQKLVRQSLEETPRTEHFTNRLYELVFPSFEREFPEEEMREVIRHATLYGSSLGYKLIDMEIDRCIADLKRLWGGEKKGGCPRCKGERRVALPRKSMVQESKYWETCTTCKGTGERRGGQEHRGNVGRRDYDSGQCEPSRRSGKDRRQ